MLGSIKHSIENFPDWVYGRYSPPPEFEHLGIDFYEGEISCCGFFTGVVREGLSYPLLAPSYALLVFFAARSLLSLSQECGFSAALLVGDCEEVASCASQLAEFFRCTFVPTLKE